MAAAPTSHDHHSAHHTVGEGEASEALGDHGAGHAVFFHGGFNEIILFHFWSVDSLFGLILSCVMCALLGVLFEGLKAVRDYLTSTPEKGNKNEETPSEDNEGSVSSRRHLMLTALYFVQLLLSYCLMMIFMTFNTWLCLAVITGATSGYFLFASKRISSNTNSDDPACH